ncbi:terminase large subunit domain-containing protein [Microbacterium paludicola]|uniref:terminase large subunit domain-containing protein n=1 Tax=Microbacterium paludicola TaxID=300019 RepID=UPI0009037927|nr:terminase large subunit [Microbacterium paludicola]APF33381.1 hypothetical protein BO218_03515 [Microbacterium paludicola]
MKSSPALHTPPLSEDFPSLWDRYAVVIRIVWRIAFGITLDPWQDELLRHVLEVYPPGHPKAGELRFRQVLISLGRQNGKTELAAILGLIGLLRLKNTIVVGIASTAEQARLVYDRTSAAIAANPSLRKRFTALTDTRGLRANDGGKYEIKAAKYAALQGIPVATGVVDEVHLLAVELWTALVNGLGGRPNGQVVGITTAGDDSSELLKMLYASGKKAAAGDPDLERFGFFLWEAPESRVPESDDELLEYLKAANPSIASGRVDAATVLSDVRSLPDADIIRYRLNRFVSSESHYVPMTLWADAARGAESFPEGRPVFAFDLTPRWGYASVTAAIKAPDGTIHTELVASIVNPSLQDLIGIAKQLRKHKPTAYVMDSYTLKNLGAELVKLGYPVRLFSLGDHISGAGRFYALLAQHKIKHDGQPLLTVQLPQTIRVNKNNGFRLNPANATVNIDAVIATMTAVYIADITEKKNGIGLH